MVSSHVYYAATNILDLDQLVKVHVNIGDIGYCTCCRILECYRGLVLAS